MKDYMVTHTFKSEEIRQQYFAMNNGLGIKLPEPPKAQGNYVGAVTYGNAQRLSFLIKYWA